MSASSPELSGAALRARLANAFEPGSSHREGAETLPAEVAQRLARYCELVLEWSARTNLTGARGWQVFAEEQVADLLPALPHLPNGPFRFVDVGSGGGLPGLVLAILRPDASGELLEPIGKKHAFLAHAIRELGLPVRASRRRLEDHLAEPAFEPVDLAVSRATWAPAVWLEKAPGLVGPGGRILAFAGAEVGAFPAAARTIPYRLAGRERFLVVLDRPAPGGSVADPT